MSQRRYHAEMAKPANDITEQLRKAIAESGMTRLQVARKAGLPYSSVHGFCGGYRSLKLESAAALCKVVGLTLKPVKPRRKQEK